MKYDRYNFGPYRATYINTIATTVVLSGRGILKRIVVNTSAAGAITVYDNTSAAGLPLGILKASIAEGSYDYDVEMQSGITIVTAAASNITVVWAPYDNA